jgi:hypothetical protein
MTMRGFQDMPSAALPSRLSAVANLDRLYDQAECLDIFLRCKVRQLALASRGCLESSAKSPGGRAEFRRLEDILENAELGPVKWAEPKPADRALEKLVTAYDRDVSRLVDCCRQRIVFDAVDDVLECLGAVSRDSELVVVRIKDRMDPACDASSTAGFRCERCSADHSEPQFRS